MFLFCFLVKNLQIFNDYLNEAYFVNEYDNMKSHNFSWQIRLLRQERMNGNNIANLTILGEECNMTLSHDYKNILNQSDPPCMDLGKESIITKERPKSKP